MADKIKKQDASAFNEKNTRTMIIKLEDIKKENQKLKEKLVNPKKDEETKVLEQQKSKEEKLSLPEKSIDSKIPSIEDRRIEKDSFKKNKETPTTYLKPLIPEPSKPKLVSMVSIGKDLNDFDDIKRATITKLKSTNLDALGNKENEIKARYMKRIQEIKPVVEKLQNLIHKLKHDKYEHVTKNDPSIFTCFEGKVSKKQEMFFKKIFLMHMCLKKS